MKLKDAITLARQRTKKQNDKKYLQRYYQERKANHENETYTGLLPKQEVRSNKQRAEQSKTVRTQKTEDVILGELKLQKL